MYMPSAEQAWVDTVAALGGDRQVAVRSAAKLTRRYEEPHRHYHSLAHVEAVLRDVDDLAEACGLDPMSRAVVIVAACCHDVVYNGQAGADEHASAEWARRELAAAGVPDDVAQRVAVLVEATSTHLAPPDDMAAQVLLDADLAVLGADPAAYDHYTDAVRAEYRRLTPAEWRRGRAAVLAGLLIRDPLFQTRLAQRRWEARARENLCRELAALADAPVDSDPG
jgi:predicted metal-dependent HD superfamily phosphohydrolase